MTHRDASHTKRDLAFTLIELLVVMGIISILSMIAVGNYLTLARRARIAGAAAEIRQIEQAVERYRIDLGDYPPSGTGTKYPHAPDYDDINPPTGDAMDCGYMTLALLHSLNGDATAPLDPRWDGPYLSIDYEQLGTPDFSEITSSTPPPQICMLDPWGSPYRYIRSDDYATSGGTELPDSDPFQATEVYFNVNTFQIVSKGPDAETLDPPEYGMGDDDVTNFTR